LLVLYCTFPFYDCENQTCSYRIPPHSHTFSLSRLVFSFSPLQDSVCELSFLFVFLLCSQKPMTRTFLRQATETSVASRKPIFALSCPTVAAPTGHIAFRCDAGHLPTVRVFRFGHSQQNALDMLQATLLTYGL
jgi:hypothetical protein